MKINYLFLAFTFLSFSIVHSLISMDNSNKTGPMLEIKFKTWISQLQNYASVRSYAEDTEKFKKTTDRYYNLIAAKDSVVVTEEDKQNEGLRELSVAAVEQRGNEINHAHFYSNLWTTYTFVSLFGFTAGTLACLAKDPSFLRPMGVRVLAVLGALTSIGFGAYNGQYYCDQEYQLQKPFHFMKKVKNGLYAMKSHEVKGETNE